MRLWPVFLAFAAGSVALAAEGPSFDCTKADGTIEELICGDAELAALDRRLAEVYGQSIEAIEGLDDPGDTLASLRTWQRGWIKGRDECWKADDQRSCTAGEYRRRIAVLEASWQLVPHGDPVFYMCMEEPANEIVATFYEAELPAVRLERGDSTEIAVVERTGSGSRYEGEFGLVFWVKGDRAQVEWPQGTSFECRVRP